jgi:hypothetical protein
MVTLSIGVGMFVLDWLAVVFSMSAALFWTLSIFNPFGWKSRKNKQKSKKKDINAVLGGKTMYAPFGSRGYEPLGDQEQSLLKDAKDDQGAIELKHDPKHSTATGPYAGREGDYGSGELYEGRETAYEPYRHAEP